MCSHDHPDLVKQQLSLRYGRSSLKSQLDYFTPNLECENSTPARVAKVASSKDEIGRVIWESDLKAFYLANPDGSLTSVEI